MSRPTVVVLDSNYRHRHPSRAPRVISVLFLNIGLPQSPGLAVLPSFVDPAPSDLCSILIAARCFFVCFPSRLVHPVPWCTYESTNRGRSRASREATPRHVSPQAALLVVVGWRCQIKAKHLSPRPPFGVFQLAVYHYNTRLDSIVIVETTSLLLHTPLPHLQYMY